VVHRKKYRVSNLLSDLKCPRNYSEALETLISLLVQGVGELWPKIDPANGSAPSVYFYIFPNKIFLSISWLQIWWDVVKQNT